MKIALLGDIHGNHLALAAVLSAARKHGVERLLVTGDLVGYYFWPKEVLELLAPWNMVVTRGNHEDMLAEARRNPVILDQIDRKYGTGLRVALETLSPGQLDWLSGLRHPCDVEIDGCRMLLCHGAPWDVDQYIYPDSNPALLERCVDTVHDWIVLGHTHYPMEKKFAKAVVVNPGSVGQPRNRKPGAHWALLDTESRTLSFQSELYDFASVAAHCRARHPEIPYLGEVLERTQ